ncbi:Est-6 [Trypoxylus dichotomus]
MGVAIYLKLILLHVAVIFAQEAPLVEISNGLLQGTLSKSYNGRIFSSFEGIPYARPPVGDLRFEAPKAPYNWTGTWIANKKYQCLQSFSTPWTKPVILGDEDCLYVNVYVPREKPTPSDNLNVIVHFHGGGFMIGSSSFYSGPEYFMDEEVIVVTMNYRLGPFGFLSTEDDVIPGNNGLKDQSLSLLWIQNNIKFFGGNPNSVTITGMSSGASSVHLHYFSPLSKGLFHRGFSESGTALDPWSIQENALEKTKQLAMLVGCPTESSKEAAICLKLKSSTEVVEQIPKFSPVAGTPIVPFGPVIEIENNGAFLTEHPYVALIKKRVTDIPWIAGLSEQEGYGFALNFADVVTEYFTEFERVAPYLLDYNYTISEEEKQAISKQIKNRYFQESTGHEILGKLIGDRFFMVGADTSAKLQAKVNKSPVYFYILGYKGKHDLGEMVGRNSGEIGPCHGDGVLYYFKTPVSDERLNENDERMKTVFLRWLVSYADNQEPNIGGGVKWQPVTGSEGLEYLHIKNADDIRMEAVKDLGDHSFWSQLPFEENQNLLQKSSKSSDEL